jgi:hypothetical protein
MPGRGRRNGDKTHKTKVGHSRSLSGNRSRFLGVCLERVFPRVGIVRSVCPSRRRPAVPGACRGCCIGSGSSLRNDFQWRWISISGTPQELTALNCAATYRRDDLDPIRHRYGHHGDGRASLLGKGTTTPSRSESIRRNPTVLLRAIPSMPVCAFGDVPLNKSQSHRTAQGNSESTRSWQLPVGLS